MRSRKSRAIPARLEAGQRRFERWRRTRKGRARIPASLWASAVKLAGAYGLCRTARALGLDYYSLKQRVEAGAAQRSAGPAASRGLPEPAGARFVELPLLAGAGELAARTTDRLPECLLEFERADGAKLRVHLKGVTAADLAALGRSVWGNER